MASDGLATGRRSHRELRRGRRFDSEDPSDRSHSDVTTARQRVEPARPRLASSASAPRRQLAEQFVTAVLGRRSLRDPALEFLSPMPEANRNDRNSGRSSLIELRGAVYRRNRPSRPYPPQKYGVVHKTMRKRLAPVVARGTIECARCGELIGPDSKWHLDHRDDGRGWLGPSHESCNARAGLEKMLKGLNGTGAFVEEKPYRWSQRWFDDPPVGTTVNARNGMVEVYLGGGHWSQPVPFDREVG